MSPFLFVIVAEGLAGIMKKAVDNNFFRRFKLVAESVGTSYTLMQFADDTIIIGDGSWSNLWAINSILRGFEMAYGLRINMNKSKLYGIGLSPHFMLAAP